MGDLPIEEPIVVRESVNLLRVRSRSFKELLRIHLQGGRFVGNNCRGIPFRINVYGDDGLEKVDGPLGFIELLQCLRHGSNNCGSDVN